MAISVVPAESPSPADNGSPAETVSGKEILLAAATAAERAPEGSGTYWYIKITHKGGGSPRFVYETWTRPDGQLWMRGEKTKGQVLALRPPLDNPFSLFGAALTLDGLPTEPAALTAAIREGIRNGEGRTSAGPLRDDPEMLEEATFDSLIYLVSTLPAPPEVRAAAFRALAAYPDVHNLGAVPGGQGLRLPDGKRLVVDPATGRVNETSVYVMGGATVSVAEPATATIIAEWTDTLPK